ncbi:PTS transporter subunit EIIB [Streptococcus infantarius]|uniref:PTS transporter subunit EIIB n=1 Tax=Streptococcus infantarius TaxID=102684 RepID=UPI00208EAF53
MSGVAHCATRLRIVLKDNSLADLKNLKMSTAGFFFIFLKKKQLLLILKYSVFLENSVLKYQTYRKKVYGRRKLLWTISLL